MAEAGFKRARSADAVAARHAALIASARKLLDREHPDAVSLAAVAREAGLVKSAVYRYFESREDILMSVLLEDTETILEAMAGEYARLDGPNNFAAIAEIFARLTAERPRYAALASQMAATLEHNISEARLIEIKREFLVLLGTFVRELAQVAPRLGPQGAAEAAQLIHAQIAAWYPITHPAPALKAVLERPEFAVFHLDFQERLETSVRVILEGVAREQSPT